jgi:predicted RNA binding protein YcfA (HicA-like mRNA interferase family)
MSAKIRGLEARLRQAGFVRLEGKGSHRKWRHPKRVSIVISGRSGQDAKPYKEKLVQQTIEKAERQ